MAHQDVRRQLSTGTQRPQLDYIVQLSAHLTNVNGEQHPVTSSRREMEMEESIKAWMRHEV